MALHASQCGLPVSASAPHRGACIRVHTQQHGGQQFTRPATTGWEQRDHVPECVWCFRSSSLDRRDASFCMDALSTCVSFHHFLSQHQGKGACCRSCWAAQACKHAESPNMAMGLVQAVSANQPADRWARKGYVAGPARHQRAGKPSLAAAMPQCVQSSCCVKTATLCAASFLDLLFFQASLIITITSLLIMTGLLLVLTNFTGLSADAGYILGLSLSYF